MSWVTDAGLTGEVGLLARIVRLNMLVTAILDELIEPFGVTLADYLVLGAVRRSPGGRGAPTRLCQVLGRTTGGMTLTLDRLVAAGLVQRAPDPSDRRRVVVELTGRGLTLSQQVNERLHEWEAELALPAAARDDVDAGLDVLVDAIARDRE